MKNQTVSLRKFPSISARRKYIEQIRNIDLSLIGKSLSDQDSDAPVENIIGGVSLPLGLAGPLKLDGEAVRGEYYIPLVTTEGGLIASVNRGCRALRESGGATVYTYRVGATRGPVFYVESIANSKKLYKWIKENGEKIEKAANSTSHHLKYKKADVRSLSSYVFIRFYFDTEDAMGMNMVTFATEKIVKLIEKETGLVCLSLAGNFDIDKKPAWLNFINNRGFKAWAEAVIPRKVVASVLKTTPEQVFEVWLAKCMLGSAMSGSLGFNAHFANVVAAFFAATGQDLAHVVEGSMGITIIRVLSNKDLYCSVYLPAIMIGTVGGGTALSTQSAATSIIGVSKSEELVEVLAGGVLAGELSLLSSLAQRSLSDAHKTLGRKS